MAGVGRRVEHVDRRLPLVVLPAQAREQVGAAQAGRGAEGAALPGEVAGDGARRCRAAGEAAERAAARVPAVPRGAVERGAVPPGLGEQAPLLGVRPGAADERLRDPMRGRVDPRIGVDEAERRGGDGGRVERQRIGPLQLARRCVQLDRFAGDPRRRRADARARALAEAREAVPVDGAVAPVDACRERRLARRPARSASWAGLTSTNDHAVLASKCSALTQRAAFGRRLEQQAARLLLDDVVRAERVADVPGDDLLAGAELPVGDGCPMRRARRTWPRARQRSPSWRCACSNATALMPWPLARSSLSISGPDRVVATVPGAIRFASASGPRSPAVDADVGRDAHSRRRRRRRTTPHRAPAAIAATRAARRCRHPHALHSSAGLRARNIGFSHASGTACSLRPR